jgi:hypothetical protein
MRVPPCAFELLLDDLPQSSERVELPEVTAALTRLDPAYTQAFGCTRDGRRSQSKLSPRVAVACCSSPEIRE